MASVPFDTGSGVDFASLFGDSTPLFDSVAQDINNFLPDNQWSSWTDQFAQSITQDSPPDFSAAAAATPADQFASGIASGMGDATQQFDPNLSDTGAMPDLTGGVPTDTSPPDFNQPGGSSVTQATDINQTPATAPSAWDKALGWFKALPTNAQNILLGGTVGLAQAGMSSYAASQQRKIMQQTVDIARQKMKDQEAQFDQQRQDVARQHTVPVLGGDAYKPKANPGILNSALGGPGYGTPNVPPGAPTPPQQPPLI